MRGSLLTAADAGREALDAAVLAWMREDAPAWDEARFEALALRVFAHQYAHCAPYARFCRARDRSPDSVRSWREVPPVPTGAFKEVALRSFPAERERLVFRTSGTAAARRGELHLDTLELYEASLDYSLRRCLFPELASGAEKLPIRVLAPAPAELPDSSLSHMFGCAVRDLGAAGSGFDWQHGALQSEALVERLRAAERAQQPLCLCGTAFAFVHLLEVMQRRDWRVSLPQRSRVMETGGFKGRSRELPRAELLAGLCDRLGVPERWVVNQYGMTELGSQFYDSVLAEPGAPRRKLAPPWVRLRLLDPVRGVPVDPGEVGVVTLFDLANTGSVAAIQTADLGRQVADGFEVLGRSPGAEARGCSIAADAMLGAGA